MQSMVPRWTLAVVTGLVFVTVGCQTPMLRDQLADRERTIRQLRQEKAGVEQRLQAKDAELARSRAELDAARGHQNRLEGELDDLRANLDRPDPSDDGELERLRRAVGGDADVQMRDGDVVITLPNRVTFASGSSNLADRGKRVLSRILDTLQGGYRSHLISIEGHTDSDPIRKSKFETNWRLSVERAMAVRDYLESRGGIAPDRFRVVGYGPYRPVASNTTNTGKEQNRRVELVIVNG